MKHAYLLILAIAHSAYAEDPFDCVAPDVADAFLGNSYEGRGEYSTSIPPGFIELSVPPDLSLIGSQKTESRTSVAYKAPMGPGDALDLAVKAMADVDWEEKTQQRGRARGGFQTGSRPTSSVLCNSENTNALSVIAGKKSGGTIVSYVLYAGSGSCGAPPPSPPRHDPTEMMRLVPTLNLPDGARASDTGMGGNGHMVSSRVDITGVAGRSDLMGFFEDQIRDQAWIYETGWSSHHSSGSVWVLESEEDGLLIGTLHLFDSGVEPIRVRFSVTPADPTKGKNQGSWSGSST